jgi:LPXTG-motif cell wall-anchored protein
VPHHLIRYIVTHLGPLSVAQRQQLAQELHQQAATSLAGTGHNDSQAALIAVAVMLIGTLLVLVSRRRRGA